jgi:outer membrane biosynthesis protein TonB
LDAALPKMFGFQVCELVKRNESLRVIRVILVGAIHHEDRYRRPPRDLYGADAYVERHQLPEALVPLCEEFGLPLRAPRPQPQPQPRPRPEPAAEPRPPIAPPERAQQPTARSPFPESTSLPEPAPEPAFASRPREASREPEPRSEREPRPEPAAPQPEPARAAPVDPALAAETEQAERLARIIVSDVVLYNPERFEAGLRDGNVLEALGAELEEGRSLFAQRVDPRVGDPGDFLARELLRVARNRGMQ